MGLLPGSLVASGHLLLHIFLVVFLVVCFMLSNWSWGEWSIELMSDVEVCMLGFSYHLY